MPEHKFHFRAVKNPFPNSSQAFFRRFPIRRTNILPGLLLLLLGGDLGRLSGGLLFLRNFSRGLFGGLNLSLFLFGFLKLFLDLIGVDRKIVDDDLGTDREIEKE